MVKLPAGRTTISGQARQSRKTVAAARGAAFVCATALEPSSKPSASRRTAPLVLSIATLHRLEQLLRVVADAVLEDDLHVLDVRDARRRIAFDDDEIGVLAGGDGADAIGASEERGAVERGDADRFDGRE